MISKISILALMYASYIVASFVFLGNNYHFDLEALFLFYHSSPIAKIMIICPALASLVGCLLFCLQYNIKSKKFIYDVAQFLFVSLSLFSLFINFYSSRYMTESIKAKYTKQLAGITHQNEINHATEISIISKAIQKNNLLQKQDKANYIADYVPTTFIIPKTEEKIFTPPPKNNLIITQSNLEPTLYHNFRINQLLSFNADWSLSSRVYKEKLNNITKNMAEIKWQLNDKLLNRKTVQYQIVAYAEDKIFQDEIINDNLLQFYYYPNKRYIFYINALDRKNDIIKRLAFYVET